MENLAYLQSIGVTDEKTQQKCLAAMEKYGDHHWWEPDVDPREYAYYQTFEACLLGNFHHFHQSLGLLLGRSVYNFGLRSGNEEFRQEVERAWKYQIGVTSKRERYEREGKALQDLYQLFPDKIVGIPVDES